MIDISIVQGLKHRALGLTIIQILGNVDIIFTHMTEVKKQDEN